MPRGASFMPCGSASKPAELQNVFVQLRTAYDAAGQPCRGHCMTLHNGSSVLCELVAACWLAALWSGRILLLHSFKQVKFSRTTTPVCRIDDCELQHCYGDVCSIASGRARSS
jgi:hypothetical protein